MSKISSLLQKISYSTRRKKQAEELKKQREIWANMDNDELLVEYINAKTNYDKVMSKGISPINTKTILLMVAGYVFYLTILSWKLSDLSFPVDMAEIILKVITVLWACVIICTIIISLLVRRERVKTIAYYHLIKTLFFLTVLSLVIEKSR